MIARRCVLFLISVATKTLIVINDGVVFWCLISFHDIDLSPLFKLLFLDRITASNLLHTVLFWSECLLSRLYVKKTLNPLVFPIFLCQPWPVLTPSSSPPNCFTFSSSFFFCLSSLPLQLHFISSSLHLWTVFVASSSASLSYAINLVGWCSHSLTFTFKR